MQGNNKKVMRVVSDCVDLSPGKFRLRVHKGTPENRKYVCQKKSKRKGYHTFLHLSSLEEANVWKLERCEGYGNVYHIVCVLKELGKGGMTRKEEKGNFLDVLNPLKVMKVMKGTNVGGVKNHLSASFDGTYVKLRVRDEKHQGKKQMWILKTAKGWTNHMYNVLAFGGITGKRNMLSTSRTGETLDCWTKDDESGRQKIVFERILEDDQEEEKKEKVEEKKKIENPEEIDEEEREKRRKEAMRRLISSSQGKNVYNEPKRKKKSKEEEEEERRKEEKKKTLERKRKWKERKEEEKRKEEEEKRERLKKLEEATLVETVIHDGEDEVGYCVVGTGKYHIKLKGGVSDEEKKYLSASKDFDKAVLTNDKSGGYWSLNRVQGERPPRYFLLYDDNHTKRILSPNAFGTHLDLEEWKEEEKLSKREKFYLLSPEFEKQNYTYNIVVTGGIVSIPVKTFLSTSPSGKVVDLWTKDDGSLRQRWILEAIVEKVDFSRALNIHDLKRIEKEKTKKAEEKDEVDKDEVKHVSVGISSTEQKVSPTQRKVEEPSKPIKDHKEPIEMKEGDYVVRVSKGVTTDKAYLSVDLEKREVVLVEENIKHTYWRVKKVENEELKYTLMFINEDVEDKKDKYLSCKVDCTHCDILEEDSGSGREQWTFYVVENDAEGSTFNIRIKKGILSLRTYLSCDKDGGDVDLWLNDDNSGRQRWKFVEAVKTKRVKVYRPKANRLEEDIPLDEDEEEGEFMEVVLGKTRKEFGSTVVEESPSEETKFAMKPEDNDTDTIQVNVDSGIENKEDYNVYSLNERVYKQMLIAKKMDSESEKKPLLDEESEEEELESVRVAKKVCCFCF